ncbi:TetR/AcrR family transcriptional regulator [Pseudomonas sp. GD03860]|uniref:TetR/AcrR family transcriptional regulator n=1 Tax=Pseudomonas TaxID=286 RepID=UPI002363C5B2|nr:MULTISPECIES: TetR/AcrR family transcriptional regulator [Pseudomonas]MDD2057260.1 TetR/AcrR family transcriptional regulator [Pseudomonas putida]MDH0640339.1 TetR/AcrR family transcriptional regulator [Pseudomonas sp. GD03860]
MLAAITSTPSPRDRLLDAALELFATHGYQAIGLRDLAGHVGVQAGSLYHHIENKQCLLFELIESALSDLLADTKQRMKGASTTGERVRRFVQAFVAFSQNDRHRLVLISREFVNLNDDNKQQAHALKAAYCEQLKHIIADAYQGNGKPEEEIAFITHAVIGMLYGQAQWSDVQMTEPQLTDVLTRCALGIIRSE